MNILIADDEAGFRESLRELLAEKHEVLVCEDGAQALQTMKATAVDLVITDHQMPGLSGTELIQRGKELSPGTCFVLMTAFGSVQQAVEAIRLGADDYLMKPFDLAEIEHRIQRIQDLRSWQAENQLKSEAEHGLARLVGKSPAILEAKEFIKDAAVVTSPVLILGPSGTGKEVLAKVIHESSTRSSRPFVAINCASLSEQLMESDLFGHEKGAFTGAQSAKPGKFEIAKGGTIFLDEVGELTPALQAKLLRVLQEKEFFRVGGVRQIKSDARVIAATNRPIAEMVKKGSFREDLYFRLNVLVHHLKPLNERRADIPLLIEYFWAKSTRECGAKLVLTPDVIAGLQKYSYPGNIRELQNVLERLVVRGIRTGKVSLDALPPEFHAEVGTTHSASAPAGAPRPEFTLGRASLTDILEEFEKRVLARAMQESGNNQVRAAELLKVSRGALQYRLKKCGLEAVRSLVTNSDPGSQSEAA